MEERKPTVQWTPFPIMVFLVSCHQVTEISREEWKDTHVCASPNFPYMTDFWGVGLSNQDPSLIMRTLLWIYGKHMGGRICWMQCCTLRTWCIKKLFSVTYTHLRYIIRDPASVHEQLSVKLSPYIFSFSPCTRLFVTSQHDHSRLYSENKAIWCSY